MDDLFSGPGSVFLFVLVLVWWNHRSKARKERYDLITKALQSGRLDAETQRALRQALTGTEFQGSSARVLLGVGWLAFCLGIGLLGADWFGTKEIDWLDLKSNEIGGAGVTLATLGFGVLALPIVVREFDRSGGRERA